MVKRIFEILDPGPMTTIQDRGRFGFQRFGIPLSGSLDKFSSHVANRLVGASDDSPVLEMTFIGPQMVALADCFVAVAGADMPMYVNGIEQRGWSSIEVHKGALVHFGPARKGLRSYLSVDGGICCKPLMGSCSTFVAAKLGGIDGGKLKKGQFLKAHEAIRVARPQTLPEEYRPTLSNNVTLRVLFGPQDDFFDKGLDTFVSSDYIVSPKSDRMGYRLQGPFIEFKNGSPMTIISEPSMPGCVQVPPDGQPIVLFVEQTVGGYAKIATIISADLDSLAQCRPGAKINFRLADLEQAQEAYVQYMKKLQQITLANI